MPLFCQHQNIDEREKTDRVYKDNEISSEEETYVKLENKIIDNHAQEGLVVQDFTMMDKDNLSIETEDNMDNKKRDEHLYSIK